MKTLITVLLLLFLATGLKAHDYPPGPAQTAPILLRNGTLFTISDGVIENGDLLFENGLITAIAEEIEPPENAEVIELDGRHVYPGLIALGTRLGLIEIGAVRATDDQKEVGRINPDVQTHIAYDPDSEIIPTVRSNGIAYAQIVPGGTMLTGRSCLLSLDAWTKEDAAVELNLGVHLIIPEMATGVSRYGAGSADEQREKIERSLKQVEQAFDDAEAYQTAKQADPNLPVDSRWEAMLPVLSGEKPLFVRANDYRQIEYAVNFCQERGLKMILYGAKEAWKMTELLVAHDIPVVYKDAAGLPLREDDPYDQTYRAVSILHEAGVKVTFQAHGASGVRNYPFYAGMAHAWGLPKDVALRGLTLTPAEILGVDDRIGSLEVGKRATIVLSEGDIMDHITHKVTMMWIDGRVVNLDSKHEELYRKYKDRKVAR